MFNVLGRAISTLVGLLLILMGCVWVLQGLNVAFLDSFMAGDPQWAVYGCIAVLLGILQVAWSNSRQP